MQQQLVGAHILPPPPSSPQIASNDAIFGTFGQDLPSSSNVRFEDAHTSFSFRRKREGKKLDKRGLVMLNDGSIVDDTLLNVPNLFDGLTQFGAQDFKQEVSGGNGSNDLEEEIREHDREPAEDEVQAVMSLCSKCAIEPFQGAVVLAWRELQTITQHTLKALSTGLCGDF